MRGYSASSAAGEPKLTPQQSRDQARAEGNEETLHARASRPEQQTRRSGTSASSIKTDSSSRRTWRFATACRAAIPDAEQTRDDDENERGNRERERSAFDASDTAEGRTRRTISIGSPAAAGGYELVGTVRHAADARGKSRARTRRRPGTRARTIASLRAGTPQGAASTRRQAEARRRSEGYSAPCSKPSRAATRTSRSATPSRRDGQGSRHCLA